MKPSSLSARASSSSPSQLGAISFAWNSPGSASSEISQRTSAVGASTSPSSRSRTTARRSGSPAPPRSAWMPVSVARMLAASRASDAGWSRSSARSPLNRSSSPTPRDPTASGAARAGGAAPPARASKDVRAMNRRRALWLTGVAMLVLFGVEAAFDVRMQDAGGHGIIDFELAGSLEHSRRILEFWGHDGHAAARLSLWFDFLYLISYGAFWALAVVGVRDMARRLRWRRFARVGAVLVAFPIAAAAFDAIENVGLLLALGRHGRAFAPRLASVCA